MARRLSRWMPAVLVGILVFSIAYAAAATLSVSSTDLAAGNVTVAACDTDGVSASYSVSFNVTSLGYVVDTVTVGGISDACFDQDFSVSLVGASGLLGTVNRADVAAGSFTGSTANNRNLAFDFTSASPRVLSALVTGIHVSISD